MAVPYALSQPSLRAVRDARHECATGTGRLARAASGGVVALLAAAPFELQRPILELPGQSLSSVELVLLGVLAICGAIAIGTRTLPRTVLRDAAPWVVLIGVAVVSAAAASEFRANALHMAARLCLAAAVFGVATVGADTESRRRLIVCAAVGSGVLVALFTIAEAASMPLVADVLRLFRPSAALVGGRLRASGPFQYPTIASMYLEVAFALGLGLLLSLKDRPVRTRLAVVIALAIVSEGIVLTLTRAGLITMGLSLLFVAGLHVRRGGVDATAKMLALLAAIVVAQLLSSQSMEMLTLRLTSEGQARWFSATVEAPATLSIDARAPVEVPVRVTNTGLATWDSRADQPIRFSYHWLAEDSEQVVAWEGYRTLFDAPVRPDETVVLYAKVGGPGRPGRFRLMWDIEQEQRLWFSTEPGAVPTMSYATVTGTGQLTGPLQGPTRLPSEAVRPGRLLLWGAAMRMWLAHPWLGVGPDNFRLLYGRYSSVREADPRVHSNDMYVEVLAGMGVAGLLAFSWLTVRTLKAVGHAAGGGGLGLGVAAAFAAMAIHGLVDSFLSFTATYIAFAVVLGLAAGLLQDGWADAHRV
jgi:hypothetical protein